MRWRKEGGRERGGDGDNVKKVMKESRGEKGGGGGEAKDERVTKRGRKREREQRCGRVGEKGT